MSLSVPKVDAVGAAFGDVSKMPKYADIPEEFKRSSNPYCDVFGSLFYKGGKFSDFGLTVKPDLDAKAVYAALHTWMGSFEPKHEHKEAAVAYAISQWFDGTPKKVSKATV